MSLLFVGLIGLFFLIYGAGNYYIGTRFLQSFSSALSPYVVYYWVAVAVLALSPFIARLVKRDTQSSLISNAAMVGDYWLAVFYYLLILWAIVDLIRLVTRGALLPSPYLGFGVAMIVVALLSYGTWNARQPRITRYDVTVPKQANGLAELRAVLVSDIHLGTTISNERLEHMVEQINQLSPDIVFFAGDIIDGDISKFAEEAMPKVLSKLTPRLGSFAIFGNHEHIGGHGELAMKHLTEAGITVLRDKYVKVNDQFYVVGREDRSGPRMRGSLGGPERLGLPQLMEGIDHSLPIILLDHQPSNLGEPEANGADLQLSGHTHHGQFFPNNFVTGRIFEVDWGYFQRGNLQVIVSCGFGTWGPPIRIGSYSEIVDIVIRFDAGQ